MSQHRWIAVIGGLFFFASGAMAELQITANTNVWAVPSTSKSCKAWKENQEDNDVKAKYINLGNLSFLWSDHNRDLRIKEIRVSLRDAVLTGGEYLCSINGAELRSLGEGDWMAIRRASQHQYTYVATDCPMLCGGIEFQKDVMVTMNGKIEVFGEVSHEGKLEERVYGLPISVDNLEF
ncbi:hypothetical protein ACLVWU_10830 [Bdellovibrio sp. HCB290]|uniref:hypothetical protein n=1 Tax=Bdellovibrio sp. HCB290 TaxID=3394356 RepID=UPI0039B661E1